MSDRTIPQRAEDVGLVERMLERIATPEEAEAARRVLGMDRETDRLNQAYTPASPPPAPVGSNVDHLAVARDALDRYQAWVDSYPDDDPTPLAKRERTLRIAIKAVQRLESQ